MGSESASVAVAASVAVFAAFLCASCHQNLPDRDRTRSEKAQGMTEVAIDMSQDMTGADTMYYLKQFPYPFLFENLLLASGNHVSGLYLVLNHLL